MSKQQVAIENAIIRDHHEKLDTYRFTAISKFVDFMNITQSKGKQQVKFAYLFYKPSDIFENKFSQVCIKPFMIDLIYNDKISKIKRIYHNDILDMFNGQLIIKFNDSPNHGDITINEELAYLEVSFTEQRYNGKSFYPIHNYNIKHVPYDIKLNDE